MNIVKITLYSCSVRGLTWMRVRFKLRWDLSNLLRPKLEGVFARGSWNVGACDAGGANSDLVPHLEAATVAEMRVRFKLRWNVSNLLRPKLEGVIYKGVR